ncbi:hypothetical protein [Desulforhabdus sp. TSK]|uniref:hypothetical protein n=1 Tax=Desulforhabdus sp. TSK TaxID=2925014 RepID=UPI001FC8D3D1|nr:hypothetical protein [Desulforhabdus sp. TSK]GKT08306.1 hypothetical protein DSTSK_16110 [Desulforhabdus sp. TSK]
MAEIIEFGRRAQNLRSVKDSGLRQRKIEALKKIFQCTRCMMKCAKCGAQIESDWNDPQKFATPYPFCRNCHEEYEEYKERINGKGSAPRYYWHNEAWMEVWGSWLEHQQWLDQYRQSKEFLQLLEEAEELMKQ